MYDDYAAAPDHAALHAAGKRRVALAEAIDALEFAVASPAALGLAWWERVSEELHDLRDALRRHIDEVEAPTGLLAQIMDEAPRLAVNVDRMREDHSELAEAVDRALDLVGRQPMEAQPEIVGDVRNAVVELAVLVSRHRQRGADLVYEAYDVDIGAL